MTNAYFVVIIVFMFGRLIHGFTEIVYPKTCVSCKKRLLPQVKDELVCKTCWGKIRKNLPPFCSSCGRQLEKRLISKNICPACQKNRLQFDRAFSPCVYEGVIKELIHKFKYGAKTSLSKPLSGIMSGFINEYGLPMEDIDCLVPVPLHPTRLREREFNQALLLGRHIAEDFGKDMFGDAMVREKHTKTQTGLQFAERIANLSGSFKVTEPQAIKGKNVLLIDDVLTTGSTSSEAAAALKAAGAKIVFVLTLAS